MRRSLATSGLVIIVLPIVGCGRAAPPPPSTPAKVAVAAPVVAGFEGQEDKKAALPVEAAPASKLSDADRYEAALADALTSLADQKWSQALEAFEAARSINDSEFVRGEITKLKLRMDQQASADKTVRDIETILEEGKAKDAAQLARDALREFGGTDVAGRLVKLRLQADALQRAGANEQAETRFQRYRDEAAAALKEENLRAAALALEQMLQAREDAAARQQLDQLRSRLAKYDDLRRQAAELRRDPQQLDEALDALNEAAKAWDTLQVRQDIDEYSLALQKRRDNLSVAAFEVQGELGYADAGRVVAEELLPHFKSRFDLVERAHIGKVIQELKLEETFLDDPTQQQELARLAKVRYLVVGSVRRLGGITVNGRLVDARTGLVVQTGKVTAATMDDALRALPELARQLMMSDDEKLAYDQRQAQLVRRVEVVPADAPLPPPPAAGVAAAPVFEIVDAPPPAFAGLTIEHFKRFPAPPVVGVKLPPPPPPEPVLRQRLLHASLQLGDNAFRLGLHRDAHRHFDFALALSPGNFDLRLRLERVTPHVPPPAPVVIVDPIAPPFVARPRLVLLDFVTFGDPFVLPPHLGHMTAHRLAPYFRSRYDIVDPAEVYWLMARTGISMRDLMEDPAARRWIGRLVGARYFVVGTLVQTASFDVNTYMLDAEFGYLHSSARIHVHDRYELKLRLGELAYLTIVDPGERNRWLADADRFEALLLRGRQHHDRREFSVAVGIFEDALRLRPGHVQVMFHLTNSRRQAEVFALEEARRQAFLRQQAFAAEAARRQWELGRATEIARVRAVQEAGLRAEGDRRAFEQQRLLAQQDMIARARLSIQTKNFSVALDLFKGAADLVPAQTVVTGFTPRDDLFREMALARSGADKSAQLRAAQETAAREAALRVQREKELALARQKLDLERKRERAVEAAQQKGQEERDRLLYQSSFDDGQRFMSQGNYEAAVASLQAARRVKSTPAVEQMIGLALQQQALARTKDDGERKQLEAKLTAERERRQQAEAEAKRNQELYQQALASANQALAQKQLEVAENKYEEAGKLFKTDAVLTGLRKVQTARAEEKQKSEAGQVKTKRLNQLVAEGKAALAAKQYAKAVEAYQGAKKLDPDNVDVLAGLTQAEQAREKLGAEARRKAEDAERQESFARLLKSGQENLQAKQYDAAAVAFQEALKLDPGNKSAQAALAAVQEGRKKAAAGAKAEEEAKVKTEAYQKLLTDGQIALRGKRYEEAIKAFAEAQKVLPGDRTSAQLLKDAQQAKSDSEAALAAAAKKRASELERAANLQKAKDYLAAAQASLRKKDLDGAATALAQAGKLDPDNPAVAEGLRDLQQARKSASAGEEREAQFEAAVQAGQKAFAARQYAEAIRALQQAVKIDPGDARAQKLLQQAQTAAKDVSQRQAEYAQALQSGQRALEARKYAEAIKALQEATRLAPNDPEAARLLKQAQRGLIDTPKETVKEAPKDTKAADSKTADSKTADSKRFNQLMQAGQKALDDKKYDDAVKILRAAVQIMPNDQQAAKLLKQAERLQDKKADPKKK